MRNIFEKLEVRKIVDKTELMHIDHRDRYISNVKSRMAQQMAEALTEFITETEAENGSLKFVMRLAVADSDALDCELKIMAMKKLFESAQVKSECRIREVKLIDAAYSAGTRDKANPFGSHENELKRIYGFAGLEVLQ